MMRVFRFALVALFVCTATAQAAPGVLTPTAPNARENDPSVTISITRQHGTTGVVTVDYATKSSSAIAGREFVPVSGTLVFQDGERTKSVTIALIDNGTYDGNRTFFLTLSNPTGGATIATYPVGDIDIYDDEPPPQVSINDISIIEGDSGKKSADFTISITGVTRSIDIRMFWYTNSYSAEAGSDFESSGASFWFTPADTEKTISVPIIGDLAIENDERFNVYIYGGAGFTKQYGYCTIVDDDSVLSIIGHEVGALEGNLGKTNAVLTLTANRALYDVTVNFSTLDGTAVAGQDFDAVSGSVTFSGETQKKITIPIIGDSAFEPDEHFSIHLSTSAAVTLDRPDYTVWIANDDADYVAPLSIVASDIGFVEGDSGKREAWISLTANRPASGVTIHYATVDGTAVAGSDFDSVSGTLSFEEGETKKFIFVPIVGDKNFEPDEQLAVHLTASGNPVTLERSDAIVTIVNDDVRNAPDVLFDPPSPVVFVGEKTSVLATLSPFQTPITLQLAALGGTAAVPASVEVGANGGTFDIEGLQPGPFRIDVTMPPENGGGVTRLFGEVREAPRPPTISQISPSSGPVNGGTNVTITGANFTSDCTVAFGHRPAASVAFVNSTTLTAVTPAHGVGATDVSVTCGSETSTLTNGFTFHPVRRRASRS